MAIFNFGVGSLLARRTGVDQNNVAIANPTPARFAAIQDVEVDFDRTLKELQAQYQFPIDVAAGPMKISIKAKSAQIQGNLYNDLFFGQTMTSTASTGIQDAVDESHTLVSPLTIAPPGSGTFIQDMGVFYASGTSAGIQFVRVASAPALGQYSVTEPGGAYTFNATDVTNAPTIYVSYRYTVGAGVTQKLITLSNQLMGISPTFEVDLQLNYPNNSGVVNTLNFHFNACRAGKLSFPFKNTDYMINDLEIMPFADSSNNLGTITLVQ
jgi:hypothetical protein